MRLPLIIVLLVGSGMFSFAQTLQAAGTVAQAQHAVSPLFVKYEGSGSYRIARPPGLRMRNTGRTLTILGGAMLIGGIAVLSSADNDDTYTTTNSTSAGTYEEIDVKGTIGIYMILSGAGMAIPGIILWSKGAKKYNRYLERQAASVSFNGSGLSAHYRF